MTRTRQRLIAAGFTAGAAGLLAATLADSPAGILTCAALLDGCALALLAEILLARPGRTLPTGPQVPLDDRPPLWRRVLAGLLGVHLNRDNH